MKKLLLLLLAVCLLFSTACSSGSAGTNTASEPGTAETAGENSETVTNSSVEKTNAESEPEVADTGKEYDVDLTVLSSTMVYSEVYNMVTNPDDYMGKTVKMSGPFTIYQTEERNYYACIISDATACCSQGIEFQLAGEHEYPDDFPEIGTVITVTGVFNTYYEDEMMYCELLNAEMI